MANWYCSSTDYAAAPQWAASTAKTLGQIVRQLATPTQGNERVWRCTTAGTTGATEPAWTLTTGSTTADGSAVWTECTGRAVYNGEGSLLDTMSAPAAVAFSMARKLRAGYAGSCFKVRRSSDNTTLDIGFINGALDTATLLAFTGSGDGFVATWYDQSGNGRDVSQASLSNQPKIVSAGVLNIVNGRPALLNSPTSATYLFSSPPTWIFGVPFTLSSVIKPNSNSGYQVFWGCNNGGTDQFLKWGTTGSNYLYAQKAAAGDIIATGYTATSSILTFARQPSGVNGALVYNNGTQIISSTTTPINYLSAGTSSFVLFADGPFGSIGEYFDGSAWEMIGFPSTLSTADRQWMEYNQSQYYGISGPSAASGLNGPWSAPFANLLSASASGWMGAGDTCYIRDTHSVTYTAATTLNMWTISGGARFICTNSATAPPAASSYSTGALEQTSGSNNLSFSTSQGNNSLISGLALTAGSGAGSCRLVLGGGNYQGLLQNCTFTLGGSGTSYIQITSAFNETTRLVNCSVVFTSASHGFLSDGGGATGTCFTMTGGSVVGPTLSSMLSAAFFRYSNVVLKGVDLSGVGGTIVTLGAQTNTANFRFVNCKLNAAATLCSLPSSGYQGFLLPQVAFYNCDAGTTNYKYAVYAGTSQVQSETVYVRNGGASDGTTAISWKIVTGAGLSAAVATFTTEDIVQWNDTVGVSKTATLYLYSNAVLTNANCWMELDYMSSTSSPIASTASSYAGVDVTGTALSSDTSTWGGAALTYKYAISVNFTPQQKGLVRARLFVGIASATIYIDPKLVIT